MEKRDSFISYTQTDKIKAEWVGRILEEYGYSVYLQTWDNPAGESFITWINTALSSSRNFIAIWSYAYSQSPWCREEMETAFERKVKGKIEKFIPVRVENCPLDLLFRKYNRVELFDVDETEQIRRLLKAVNPGDRNQQNSEDSAYLPSESFSAAELNRIGNNYYYGRGVQQDYYKARKYSEQAAVMDYPCAIKNLGYLYSIGLGVMQDYETAKVYFEKAASRGNIDAIYNLGVMYENGLGVNRDVKIAQDYYRVIGESTDHPHTKMHK